ncbi:hypothetical protein HK15_12295 [Acetobacter orientalis]|uniref:Uncharacterized protein n=1 Tax=Acetobacter orientalis TaxID=146474 RepID=A0A252BGG7_9PROT|nr:hypothetical protein HK15_12295 [Acetobacter orientalis]
MAGVLTGFVKKRFFNGLHTLSADSTDPDDLTQTTRNGANSTFCAALYLPAKGASSALFYNKAKGAEKLGPL